jgi:hypothetical protein
MFMPSARSNPLDSNPPSHRPGPQSRAQNLNAPGHRLIFLFLFKTLLGIAMTHTALGGPDRDHIIGLIRALIDRLEQQGQPAPSTGPTQHSQHPGTARIIARARRYPGRSARRTHRPHAKPFAPPPPQSRHRASANQVHGPPPHPRQQNRPVIPRRPHPAATSLPRCPRTAVWRRNALSPA